jgi:acetyltransferase
MTIRNLDRIFAPRSVAIIGASARVGSVGNSVLQNLRTASNLKLFPVNPKHDHLDGLPCWPSIASLPAVPDLAVIATPAATVPSLVQECGAAGVGGLVILTAGFGETGATGKSIEAEVRQSAAKFPEMRILGPNCLGFMAPHRELNASFVDQLPPRGSVAFISQSGALCSAILDWATTQNVGFSYFISLGNMLDIGVAELLDYLAEDPWTKSVVLYLESVTEARQFMSAARGLSRSKPIIAYKAGRYAESAKAAASHTGALAGVDAVYEAAFARAGIVRVLESEDLFDCAELLSRSRPVRGPRLAIVTNAGGPGVMATDALIAVRGQLAKLNEATITELNNQLPATWSHNNPVDIIGDAPPERFRAAISAVLADEGVDALLVILSPQSMTDPTRTAEEVIASAAHSSKPVLTSWMGGQRVAEGITKLQQAGISNYASPEQAIRAFTYLVSAAVRQELLYETPREMPLKFSLDKAELRDQVLCVIGNGSGTLTEDKSKEILAAYGIPITRTLVATSAKEAITCSRELGYPVVLKLYSPDITHKSDVGGVELNLSNDAAVERAWQDIVSRAQTKRPEARILGVTVQSMVLHPQGRELIVGAKRDPVFGSVLLVGAGGTAAEIWQDSTLELPPLSERLGRRMLESLRSWPLLQGYRGKPGVNVDQLIETLMRVSYLVAHLPEITELDINPLLATPDGALALDARIVLGPAAATVPAKPYSHLAIRPYPDEFIREATLADGTPLLLRPIQPEDEPLWRQMMRECSNETIYRRFRCLFREVTHQMAARFCFVDYDRELAIVAEQRTPEGRRLLGVGRLVANVDHSRAEYAVLVIDAWQGRGLGSLLTDYCLAISQSWGVRYIQAETSLDNHRMVTMFQRRGFQSQVLPPDTLRVWREYP